LAIGGLHRHEPYRRPAHSLAQSLGVSRIVLTAFDVWLDVLRRDQSYLMTKGLQQACPVVRSSAGFDCSQRWRQLREEGDHLLAPQFLAQHRFLGPGLSQSLQMAVEVAG
jgi:hypothetical protein